MYLTSPWYHLTPPAQQAAQQQFTFYYAFTSDTATGGVLADPDGLQFLVKTLGATFLEAQHPQAEPALQQLLSERFYAYAQDVSMIRLREAV